MNSNWNIDPSWTLFLDRDGVINQRNFNGYITHPNEFVFLNGSLEALNTFSKLFDLIFIVTNQQCVGKGIISTKELKSIHSYMLSEINRNNGFITDIYFAPELKTNHMQMRKPLPKMAELAKQKHSSIDFKKSIMIGDTDSDIEFGKNLGMKTVCIRSKEVINSKPDVYCESLFEFSKLINE
tara:strand:- start:94 stop:639 length:546 start_codon:yes stop_codon:yes gene_type:complete